MNDRFELEVTATLAKLSRVDRSTVELTRASIAALPDRRSSRTARVGLRLASWSVRRRQALSLVGLGALVVAIVGVSLFGRFQSAPVGPGSPTPSTETPLKTASAPPSVKPTPTLTDRPPQAFDETLPVVYTGGSLRTLGWAPDGSAFAILDQQRSSDLLSTVHLIDRFGVETQSIDASQFAWLSPSALVIIRFQSGPDGDKQHAYVGRVGSQELTPIPGSYYWIVAGPSGAVALMKDWDGTLASQPQYVVMSGGTPSAPRSGYPTAWSRDGSMLAVFHPTSTPPPGGGGGGQTAGWLEVVRSTGESVASARKIQSPITAFVAFSPDGGRVALDGAANSAGTGNIRVLNIGSVRVDAVGVQVGGIVGQAFTWAGNDELLFGDSSWSAKTGKVATSPTSDVYGASGLGMVVRGSNATHLFTWTNPNAGAVTSGTFSLGASTSNAIPDRAWSPDGRSLVLISGDSMAARMDAVMVRF